MDTHIDFLQWLQVDMALKVLMSLDDPSDLIRTSAVSRFWHQFVISNGLCKTFCLRLFPQLSYVACIRDSSCTTRNSVDLEFRDATEWEALEREHRTYAFLGRALTTFTASECIADTISASSTDNYPQESIRNTLDPRDRFLRRASYWSSKGKSDPEVPETIIYKLISNLCVITEINIQPFRAYFQINSPIYSAKAVRFRMGHPRSPSDMENLKDFPLQAPADDMFIWTYTSPKFLMDQENCLQKFKLPEPVLGIGGYLQIELLGRVQRQEMDGLYYICISHVKALGRSLYPACDAEILEPSGKFLMKYFPEARNLPPPTSHYSELAVSTNPLQDNLRGLEQLLNMLNGNPGDLEPYEWEDDDENDLDFVVL